MKHILITGGNSGIGKATAMALAASGDVIIIACRDKTKGDEAALEIRAATKNDNIHSIACDLSSFESIKSCIQEYKTEYGQLDVIINNAGLITDKLQFTSEGYEMQIGVNHLGHFLLTTQLLDLLLKSNEARIVNVSSKAHYKGNINFNTFKGELDPERYKGMAAYSQSKLANVLFTKELARRYPTIWSHSLHPGVVRTAIAGKNENSNLWKFAWKALTPFMISAEKGAKTSVYLASSPEALLTNGKYFFKSKETAPAARANDEELAKKLWQLSEEMVQ